MTATPGLILDLAPQTQVLDALFARVKLHTLKPVAAAATVWDAQLFKITDFVVLKAFDHALSPADYASAIQDQIGAFLRDARDDGGKAHGRPARPATRQEYESKAESASAAPQDSGHKMQEYFDAGRKAVGGAVIDNDPAYLGIGVWAMQPDGPLHGPQDQAWYQPTVISPALWDSFKLPVVHP